MKSVKILWNYMKDNRLLYLGSMLCVGLATLATISGPLVIRFTLDALIGDEPPAAPLLIRPITENLRQTLWVPGIVLITSTAFRGFFIFLRGKFSAQASEGIAKNIRDRLYDHLQHLSYKYHKEVDTGDLMQRCTSDVETIRRFLGAQLVEVGNALFMLASITTIMVRSDLRMTLISLAVVPLVFAFAIVFFRKVKTAFKQADEAEAEMTTVLQENLTGIRVVRAFANQEHEIKRFSAKNEAHRDKVRHLIWLLACYWASSDFLALAQIGFTMVAGAYYTAKGAISIGTMVLFSTYIGMLLWPVRQLGRILTDMGKALVAVERLEEIFSEPRELLVQNGLTPPILGRVVFKDVSFSYQPGQPVLQNLSFTVQAGQTVGILGHTGSGKSSLAHLLVRLYDYDAGAIEIDGVELQTIDKKWIRRHVAIVPQEPFLFAKTIKDNITLAKTRITDQELYDVCRQAAVHEVIAGFDQGYQTLVGERGVSVSGGQRQRIAIARALIAQSPILVFDDSLSAVDTATDLAIRNALAGRARRATTFLISHRIASLIGADLILVLEEGRIVQRGSHLELLGQPGPYQRIWEIQNTLEAELRV